MTSPSETIEKAMEGVTPPDKLHVVFATWKSDGSLNIRRWSTFMEFEGSTAYVAEPVVKTITEDRDALARQAEAMKREMAEKDDRISALEAGLKPFAKFTLDSAPCKNQFFLQLLVCPESDEHPEDYRPHFRRARTLIQGEKK